MQAITDGTHVFTVSGNGLTMMQNGYVPDTTNSNTYIGDYGVTIYAGGLAVENGGVTIEGECSRCSLVNHSRVLTSCCCVASGSW